MDLMRLRRAPEAGRSSRELKGQAKLWSSRGRRRKTQSRVESNGCCCESCTGDDQEILRVGWSGACAPGEQRHSNRVGSVTERDNGQWSLVKFTEHTTYSNHVCTCSAQPPAR